MPDTDLSSSVDLERFSGFSLLEMEALKTGVWEHIVGCHQPPWKCVACHSDRKAIRRVLAAIQPMIEQDQLADLAAAGRLLPEGATHKANFVLRWYGPTLGDGDGSVDWGCDSLEHARRAATEYPGPPTGAVRGEIQCRESWAGPWAVVEPVAVEGRSDG